MRKKTLNHPKTSEDDREEINRKFCTIDQQPQVEVAGTLDVNPGSLRK